ncbi:conserved hypothetical protein [Methanocaldococcus infernus ME]|uniref:Uncharacterized protein n=1 Tax=Methanocaldococcus infernus (strain DSM 11812 / JCM 15783 / ME) TaxID=573063 RepID=D5VU94_METIM|nr:hypothetical protein [Methanocaldococcus infernus]ADG12706.1 conserved hypothetical protein [Methanocaldococcus infernus ME]
MKTLFLGKELDGVESYNVEDCMFLPFNAIDIAKYNLSIIYLPLFFKDLTSYSANQASVITILKDLKIMECLEKPNCNVVVIDPYFKDISRGRVLEHYLMKHITRDEFTVKVKEGEDIKVKDEKFKPYIDLIGRYSHIYNISDENGKLGLVDSLTLFSDYETLDYEVLFSNEKEEVLGIKIYREGSLYILHPPREGFKDYVKLIEILSCVV